MPASTPKSSSQELTPASLNLIRFALLAGIVLFGAVVTFLHMSGSFDAGTDEQFASMLTLIFFGLTVAIGAGLFVVHGQWKAAESFQKRATFSIVGWAMGESCALFGAVVFMLTGSPYLFLAGLLIFLVPFFLLSPKATGAADRSEERW